MGKKAISYLLVAMFLYPALAFGQKPEYDFYSEFRDSFTPKLRAENPSVTKEEIVKRYAAKLKNEGITDSEIARRTSLIRTERDRLESDYWNRVYTEGKANFNKAPNSFLMQMVEGRRPGAALDYGMGEGRNAIYLAKLGWQVWGFDPADAAVALAQKRAQALGLTLHTAAVRDSEYEFGKERFDLILFSWTMPLVPVQKVVDALKSGGIVVMECGADFVGRNEMLKMFDALQIVRYEIVRGPVGLLRPSRDRRSPASGKKAINAACTIAGMSKKSRQICCCACQPRRGPRRGTCFCDGIPHSTPTPPLPPPRHAIPSPSHAIPSPD